jgi:hypothetical protein
MAVLKIAGKIDVSWLIVVLPAILGLALGLISNVTGAFSGLLGGGGASGSTKDSCGCAPGQNAVIAKQGLFRVKNKRVLPCSQALLELQKKKMIQLGCSYS